MYHLISSIALGFVVSIYSCNDASMMSGNSAKRAKSISTNDGDGFDADGNPNGEMAMEMVMEMVSMD